jgi:hypothetical protein
MTFPIDRRAFIVVLGGILGERLHPPIRMIYAETNVPQVAFLGFQIINTSIEPTTPEEDKRVRMLDDLVQQKLLASGDFKLVTIPADLRQEIAGGPGIASCNGCQRDYAQKAGLLGAWFRR